MSKFSKTSTPKKSAPKSYVTGGTTHARPVSPKPGKNGAGPVGR